MNKFKLAFLAAGISFAIAFTFSCSGDNEPGGESGNPNVNVDTDGKNVEQLLAEGVESLKAEKWDEAAAYYDAAYEKDNNDAKAIIYSVLANLAKISIDPKVVSLMKNHLGFTSYPNKLNALFSDDWLKEIPDDIKYYYCNENTCGYWYDEYELEWYDLDRVGYYNCNYNYEAGGYVCTLLSSTPQYDSTFLPTIKTPDWVKGDKNSIYSKALLSGNVFGSEAWAISLLANLLEKNVSGANDLLVFCNRHYSS